MGTASYSIMKRGGDILGKSLQHHDTIEFNSHVL
jgi:hypothetical protein